MMTIITTDGSEFQIHRGLLCFHSEYFRKLLEGPFTEGGSEKQTLSDVSCDTFTMFYNWMYTGTVVNSTEQPDADLGYDNIVNIYIFADFHMVPTLKRRALELFWLHMLKTWTVGMDLTSRIYKHTTGFASLRKLHIDLMLETCTFENWREDEEKFCKESLADILDACRKLGIVPGSRTGILSNGIQAWIMEKKKDFCVKYHEHERKPDTGTDAL
jgi:hypothetical protein